nr:response regulator transcription factor [Arenibaculum pallidiluteum]
MIVVDDEPEIRALLCEILVAAGHRARPAADGKELDFLCGAGVPDVVLLDLNLPGENGFSIARRLRSTYDPGIIMVSAIGDVIDRVAGLEAGADDYITKPFEPAEVVARVTALLRRRGRRTMPQTLPFGRYAFDPKRFVLLGPDGGEVPLRASEVDLVAAFAMNANRMLTRDELIQLAPGRDGETLDRSIDSRIARLRRKLETEPERPALIRTVRGVGYIHMAAEPEDQPGSSM